MVVLHVENTMRTSCIFKCLWFRAFALAFWNLAAVLSLTCFFPRWSQYIKTFLLLSSSHIFLAGFEWSTAYLSIGSNNRLVSILCCLDLLNSEHAMRLRRQGEQLLALSQDISGTLSRQFPLKCRNRDYSSDWGGGWREGGGRRVEGGGWRGRSEERGETHFHTWATFTALPTILFHPRAIPLTFPCLCPNCAFWGLVHTCRY